MTPSFLYITLMSAISLLAFAGNSILCRLALGDGIIDASSFTAIRLLSGIVMLFALLAFKKGTIKTDNAVKIETKGSWLSAAFLFIYAVTFSFAYISLDTGTGALILFGTVQLTMILTSVFYKNKLYYWEWLGVLIAFSGLVYLVKPSLTTPSLMGFILMIISGMAWAGYTLKGRASINPINDTRYNFLRTFPFIIILILFSYQYAVLSSWGVVLAILSGALTSAIGYAIWYIVLPRLSVIQASVIQLFVPTIAAFGGTIFMNELISIRLILSSLMVLGGISLVILGRHYYLPKEK